VFFAPQAQPIILWGESWFHFIKKQDNLLEVSSGPLSSHETIQQVI
jgi:hypothetical protein